MRGYGYLARPLVQKRPQNKIRSYFLFLQNRQKNFHRSFKQPPQSSEWLCFQVHTEDIGKPFKVRIELELEDQPGGWFCDEVRLISTTNPKESFVFPCGRWLSLYDDDWQLYKELPLVVDGVPVFPGGLFSFPVKFLEDSVFKLLVVFLDIVIVF